MYNYIRRNIYEDFYPYNRIIRQNRDMHGFEFKDYGKEPFTLNLDKVTRLNNNFRTALWTGDNIQLTLMSLKPGESIGLEAHPNIDQLIYIHEGNGTVFMGKDKDNLDYIREVTRGFAFIIPAGYYHNLINTGNVPIKLHSLYAPPEHKYGTIHKTKADDIEHHNKY